jgi:hypothetical protein
VSLMYLRKLAYPINNRCSCRLSVRNGAVENVLTLFLVLLIFPWMPPMQLTRRRVALVRRHFQTPTGSPYEMKRFGIF